MTDEESDELENNVGENNDELGDITFVPSVHYSPAHVRRVDQTIREAEPDVVAIELGDRRFRKLDRGEDLDPREMADELPGSARLAYMAFKAIQENMVGNYRGLDTNDTDMNAAVRTAAATDTPIALIDDPVNETFGDILDNVSLRDIPEILSRAQDVDEEQAEELQEYQKSMMEDIGEVESGDDIQPMVDHFRGIAPEITDVLIDKRDRTMAERLHRIRENGYDAVAIIGAGHHNGILTHLERLENQNDTPEVTVPIRESEQEVTDIPL